MYEFNINDKEVRINLVEEEGTIKLKSYCDNAVFNSGLRHSGDIIVLLVSKRIVGVGMYSGEQDKIQALYREYEERQHEV